ncbi:MAG TPA: TRAP transporter small permease subunit [Nitratifractor sp.]|nr:TRAP transporter small permease subunit [Nitratifractor sp.]HHD74485.1 TRAP transporter small permease subunit [Nitratifractor sp.]HHH20862.1 TRAP transporter small permease subunit [Nitratifractor sp.]
MLLKIERFTDKIIDFFGLVTAVLLVLMILNVAFDVAMRYIFHNSSIGMQELEWHLFAVIILYGTGYALKHNAHVRVDFLYDNFSARKQAWVNVLGTIFFLLPLALLVIYGSWEFVMDSYTSNEISEDPGGLPYRWIIKAQIPIAFIFLLFSAFNFLLHNVNTIKGNEKPLVIEEDQL